MIELSTRRHLEENLVFGLICANCGCPGQEMELPDGTTCFYCQKCGGSEPTTIDFFEEIKGHRRVKDEC